MQTNIDYLVLGQTVPEKSKKYGARVCTAGVSLNKMDFVRVYPLLPKHHFKRWEYYPSLPVERNNKDSRDESWKLSIHPSKLNTVLKQKYSNKNKKALIEGLYDWHGARSIDQLNEERRSLAIIKIKQPHGFFVNQNKEPSCARQLSLFDSGTDESLVTKEGYKYLPRIEFKTEDGKKHNYWFNSWDAYMHQKMLSPTYGVDNLWKACNLHNGQYALIGNLNSLRNTWLIISLF